MRPSTCAAIRIYCAQHPHRDADIHARLMALGADPGALDAMGLDPRAPITERDLDRLRALLRLARLRALVARSDRLADPVTRDHTHDRRFLR